MTNSHTPKDRLNAIIDAIIDVESSFPNGLPSEFQSALYRANNLIAEQTSVVDPTNDLEAEQFFAAEAACPCGNTTGEPYFCQCEDEGGQS